MITLTARDSSGARVGLHYFTDPKLIAAGKRESERERDKERESVCV